MHLRVESIDETLPSHKAAMKYYQAQALRAQQISYGYLSRHARDFDLAILNNGMSFEPAHFAAQARKIGLDFITLDKFAFRHVRLLTHGDDLFSFRDLDVLWKRREELGYLDEPFYSQALARASELLHERRTASQRNWAWKYQNSPGQSDGDAFQQAGIDHSKPFNLICPNVPFDAGFYLLTKLFGSMREWLLETTRLLLQETDINIVIRIHPGGSASYRCTGSQLAEPSGSRSGAECARHRIEPKRR